MLSNDFFEFDKNTAKDKLTKISLYKQDIIQKIKQKTFELIELQNKKDERWQELYIYYLTEYPIKLKNNEAKEFVEKDKEILKLNKEIKEKEVAIKELEETLKNLDTLMWSIKNYLDWIKLENGILS